MLELPTTVLDQAAVWARLDRLSLDSLSWLLTLVLVSSYPAYFYLRHQRVRPSKWRSPEEEQKKQRSERNQASSKAAEAVGGKTSGPCKACLSADFRNEQYDAIVVGAGVAGAALAYSLGKEGRRVLVLERDLREPDRIVGELLQPGGYLKLLELGLADCVEGIDAQEVEGYVLLKGGEQAHLKYPHRVSPRSGREGQGPEVPGPPHRVAGRGFHNGRFVQRLRYKAASLPSVTLVEATVTGLVELEEGREGRTVGGVRYRLGSSIPRMLCTCSARHAPAPSHQQQQQPRPPLPAAEGIDTGVTACGAAALYEGGSEGAKVAAEGQEVLGEVHAPLTFVCDGNFSNLRRAFSHSQIQVPSNFVGLLLRGCALPRPNYGHVVLAHPSPVLFYPISSTEVRCLVDCLGPRAPSSAGGSLAQHLLNVVCPQMPPELQGPFTAAVESGDIRVMPNRIMPAVPVCRPGALLMGDAFNMRHPLTGGGMTVALSDIAVLAEMLQPLSDFSDTASIQRCAEAFFMRRKPVASTINTLASALHSVMCTSPDPAHMEMREACFNYLALGGVCATGPVALLSGLNPQPLSLVLHFFAVAFYGVSRLLRRVPSAANVVLGFNLVKGASEIIFPIIRSEGLFRMFFPALFPSWHFKPTLPTTSPCQ